MATKMLTDAERFRLYSKQLKKQQEDGTVPTKSIGAQGKKAEPEAWWKQTLNKEFPGAIEAELFVKRTMNLLSPFGFDGPNTIACVGLCRDEICAHPFQDFVTKTWGEAFNFSALAGILTLGKTGWAAARGHAPIVHGKERFIFILQSHIGIDAGGNVGKTLRDGQKGASSACGALVALLGELSSGEVNTELDPEDLELSLLRRRLTPMAEASETPTKDIGIVELTNICRKASLSDLETLLDHSGSMTDVDYAIFSSVQVHTPEGDYICPGEAYAVVKGKRIQLEV